MMTGLRRVAPTAPEGSVASPLMPLQREQPDWVRAAEELVRRVRRLLDDHGAAFEDALARSMGSLNEARAEVDQIEALVHVLEIELWRRDKPRVSVGGRVAVLLMGGLGLVAGQTLDNVANDMYDALTGAQHQAKGAVRVHRC